MIVQVDAADGDEGGAEEGEDGEESAGGVGERGVGFGGVRGGAVAEEEEEREGEGEEGGELGVRGGHAVAFVVHFWFHMHQRQQGVAALVRGVCGIGNWMVRTFGAGFFD